MGSNSSGSVTGSIKSDVSGSIGFDRPGTASVSDKMSGSQEAAIERLKARTEEARSGLATAKQQALSSQSQMNNTQGVQNQQQGMTGMAIGTMGVVGGKAMIAKGVAMNMVPFVGTAPGAAMITAGKVTMGIGAAGFAAGLAKNVSGNQQVNVARGQSTQATTQGGISQTAQSQASTHNSKADQLEADAQIIETSIENGEGDTDDLDIIEGENPVSEESDEVVLASALPEDLEASEFTEEEGLSTYLNEDDEFRAQAMGVIFGDERIEEISSELVSSQEDNPDFANLSTEEQVQFNLNHMEDKLINDWVPGANSDGDFSLSNEDLTDMVFIDQNLTDEEFSSLRGELENIFDESPESTANMSAEEKFNLSLGFYAEAVMAKEDTI